MACFHNKITLDEEIGDNGMVEANIIYGNFGTGGKKPPAEDNCLVLSRELDSFTSYLAALGFGGDGESGELTRTNVEFKFQDLTDSSSAYGSFLKQLNLSLIQRKILLLLLIPELRPGILDPLFIIDPTINKGFADVGGIRGKTFSGFIPTVETALFLFAGNNLAKRFELLTEFYDDAHLIKSGILILESDNGEPFGARKIEISKDILSILTETQQPSPHSSSDFPAKQLMSPLNWSDDAEQNDLILNKHTEVQLSEMVNWIQFQDRLIDMRLPLGYRAMFYGPPGTGKTLTASLLGKRYNKPVYRVDLSLMISKYIGETEKNLEKVFSMAENKDWILFFDEADSLFGKRTDVSSSNDKYANQETSFLLQRVEEFPGLVILATNYKDNIDKAFVRRFQSVMHFPMPGPEERERLWNRILEKIKVKNKSAQSEFVYADDVDIKKISKKRKLHKTESHQRIPLKLSAKKERTQPRQRKLKKRRRKLKSKNLMQKR